MSEFRFIKNDFQKNAILLVFFSFLYRRVTFHQKIDKIKNQKIKNKNFGLQGHVIPRWKGITLGVKMAFKNVRDYALSGRRAQKTSFLKALFRAEFDPRPALARKIAKCQIFIWILR